jgi:uncharacterized protein (DUF1697 family)
MACVVFLRGVNVGGHRTFRPSVLASEMAGFGIVNVGAAGTFVVQKPISQAELRRELCRRLPFETEVMICRAMDTIKFLGRVEKHLGGSATTRNWNTMERLFQILKQQKPVTETSRTGRCRLDIRKKLADVSRSRT